MLTSVSCICQTENVLHSSASSHQCQTQKTSASSSAPAPCCPGSLQNEQPGHLWFVSNLKFTNQVKIDQELL